MYTPEDARSFLRWYDGKSGESGQPPQIPNQTIPDWYHDFEVKWDSDGMWPEHGVPLLNYDIDARLNDENVPSSDEYVSGRDNLDRIIQIWEATVRDNGFEAIAWYRPFHIDVKCYGIYIDERGLQVLAILLYKWSHGNTPTATDVTINIRDGFDASVRSEIETEEVDQWSYDGEPLESLAQAFNLALEILLRHEWYHHQVEILATIMEDFSDEMVYRKYKRDWYQSTYAESLCIEESLANAYVERSRACHNCAPSAAAFRTLFEQTTRGVPEAYRDYHRFTGQQFQEGGKHLAYLLQNPDTSGDPLSSPSLKRALGSLLPLSTNIRRVVEKGRLPVYILQEPSPTPHLAYFKTVRLETDYEIIRTDPFNKAYEKIDGSVKQRIDNTVEKLERNIDLPGFNWEKCEGRYWYLRVNRPFRMIADRDDEEERVELIDVSTDHDLPERYGCYT